MFQVRLHGRGGQGVVTAAEILSIAAFRQDFHSQAFPSFGSERMGAPVTAFCRMDDRAIRLREPVTNPDCLIIQDATLLAQVPDLFAGLKSDGYVLLNTARAREGAELERMTGLPAGHWVTVDATAIARKHLGRPLPNAALLGAFAALTGRLKLERIQEAIMETFPGKAGTANCAAAAEAHAAVTPALAAPVAV
jgi:pyruvate ferredoxin oxidoreductase gamma subunit